MARYDWSPRRAARYDAWAAEPFTGWYPGAFWAGAPMFGWGGAWAWPPYAPVGYGTHPRDFAPPRRPPRESPTYGRGGDRAARRWAREHGYDAGYEIRPRGGGGGRRYGW